MVLVQYNSVFIPLCSPNTCNDVFNPNLTTFQSNCAESLHFSAFHICHKTLHYIIEKQTVAYEIPALVTSESCMNETDSSGMDCGPTERPGNVGEGTEGVT